MNKISRILIANRGEIARRIALSARQLGIETTVIVAGTPPLYLVGVVDAFIKVQREDAAMYSNRQLMIQLAQNAGCDAIHPGFGFLSECAEFAQQVVAAGLVWIGPSPAAIASMGSKATAREIATSCDVPLVPGMSIAAPISCQEELRAQFDRSWHHGYPLLIKAATGGGGRGMQVIHAAEELSFAKLSANAEISANMEHHALIVEKYLQGARHIEVQVIADQHGNTITLGDRECSIQRRHQKMIEEAPAILGEPLRRQIHDAALRLARRVNYDSLGTVEFLVTTPPGQPTAAADFYFLEMNTRLQVEHTVTEQVFSVDLVELQIKLAMGEELPTSFGALTPRGHSIEARIYAENFHKGFLPAPGMIKSFEPYHAPYLRWEIGIDTIDEVTAHFDPMIAKAISTGASRAEAAHRLRHALAKTVYFGPESNLPLIGAILQDQEFLTHGIDTNYLKRALPGLISHMEQTRATLDETLQTLLADCQVFNPDRYGHKPAWLDARALTRQVFKAPDIVNTPLRPLNLMLCDEQVKESQRFPHVISRIKRGMIAHDNAPLREFWLVEASVGHEGVERLLSIDGITMHKKAAARAYHHNDSHSDVGTDNAVAPVPGRVVAINVKKDQVVAKNETIMILESMKMEFEVKAPCAIKIRDIKVRPGSVVTADELLLVWERGP